YPILYKLATPLFPSTTLFRSVLRTSIVRPASVSFWAAKAAPMAAGSVSSRWLGTRRRSSQNRVRAVSTRPLSGIPDAVLARAPRSEEHTSELQSRGHLVCRLL